MAATGARVYSQLPRVVYVPPVVKLPAAETTAVTDPPPSSALPTAVTVTEPPAAATSKSPKPAAKKSTAPAQVAAATSEIAPESVCPGQSDPAQQAAALACLTSHARQFHGLSRVSINVALAAAAGAKAADIATCHDFSHTACGRDAFYWIAQKGYGGNCTGENIAQGQKTPRDVFTSWMNSAGHRANILRPDYHDIGTAYQPDNAGPIWVMELGGC